MKITLYRMVQECFTNVARHAQASKVEVSLSASGQQIELVVTDDGRGFPPAARTKRDSFGLFGLSERAAQLGGTVAVTSAPGGGTRVFVCLRGRALAGAT